MQTLGVTMTDTQPVTPVPAVQILRGQPDDVEVAALVAGLAASATVEEFVDPGPDAWADRSRILRGAPRPIGTDAWRWSMRG